jgi:hypothetical protein
MLETLAPLDQFEFAATSLRSLIHATDSLWHATGNLVVAATPTATVGQQCRLVCPDVLTVVWTRTVWHKFALPHHYAPAEIAHFFAVLIETFCLHRHDSAVIF